MRNYFYNVKPLVAYAIETSGMGGNGHRYLLAHSISHTRREALEHLHQWKYFDETAKLVRVKITKTVRRKAKKAKKEQGK